MIMFKFVKVEYYHPRMNNAIEYGYVLKIDSLIDLLRYEIDRGDYGIQFEDGLSEVLKSSENEKEFYDAFGGKDNSPIRAKHAETTLGSASALLSELLEKTYLDAFIDLSTRAFKAKMDALDKYRTIYIQSTHSFFVKTDDTNELSSEGYIESDKLIFPDEDKEPRYIQWRGGTHWYVKVGDIDVMVDGQQKWDTKEEAKLAYEKWLELED